MIGPGLQNQTDWKAPHCESESLVKIPETSEEWKIHSATSFLQRSFPPSFQRLLVQEQGSALGSFLWAKENQQHRISPGLRKVMEAPKDSRDLLGAVSFAVHKHAKHCGGAQKGAAKSRAHRKVENIDTLLRFSILLSYWNTHLHPVSHTRAAKFPASPKLPIPLQIPPSGITQHEPASSLSKLFQDSFDLQTSKVRGTK